MANVKISELSGYVELNKENDLLAIVDKTNLETKKIIIDDLLLAYSATPEEVSQGLSTTKYITPKSLYDSSSYVQISFVVTSFNGSKALTTLDKAYQDIPNEMDGYTLVSWSAMCVNPSSSGDIVFSVINDGVDMFTAPIIIDAGETSSRTSHHIPVLNPFAQKIYATKILEFGITSAGTGVTYAKLTLGFKSKYLVGGGGGGGGDVVGPNSAEDGNLPIFDGTSGKIIKDSGVNLSEIANGDVHGPEESINNNVAIFDGVTGKVIKDSGLSISEIKDHNQLTNLQGGDSTSVEFYHLTEDEYTRVGTLLYAGEWEK